MTLFTVVTREGPIGLALVFGLGTGLLLSEPAVVLMVRRQGEPG